MSLSLFLKKTCISYASFFCFNYRLFQIPEISLVRNHIDVSCFCKNFSGFRRRRQRGYKRIDFKALVKESHKRELHIVLDFITTVVSVQHPFFQDVLNNPNSPYKDWFITSPVVPEGQWMNFNDYQEQFKSSAWKPLPHGGYYYSLWGNSPFFDFHNPKVHEYIFSVVDFWLDLGIDGFRIDATKHLYINGPGTSKPYHQPENFVFWRQLRKHIMEKYGPDKVLIAETIPIPNNYNYVIQIVKCLI